MKKVLLLSVLILAFVLILPAGEARSSAQKTEPLIQKKSAMETHKEMSSLSGKVVETMNSGGYTYVNIEKAGVTTWLAIPQTEISVGQDLSFYPGMTMNNFTSKSLDRTFNAIIFSGGVIGRDEKESPNISQKQMDPQASNKKPEKVEKASGPDAYTVSELYAKSSELDRKNVVFRGKAVKFSGNIMGKNWIHIQDGSGSPAKGTNDILVTSLDTVSEGDVVTVQGTLYRDKDFGAGYRYAVIVEDAHLKK